MESVQLKGVQYVTDNAGKRTAVIISLEEWGELWEDIYDVLVSQARKDEPAVSWETLQAEMGEEEMSRELKFLYDEGADVLYVSLGHPEYTDYAE